MVAGPAIQYRFEEHIGANLLVPGIGWMDAGNTARYNTITSIVVHSLSVEAVLSGIDQ